MTRIGIRVLGDSHTNGPDVMFYVTKRVGGGLLDPNAFKVLRLPA
jgi:HK97 family phage major capsid protein